MISPAQKQYGKVAVVMGGTSNEREISLLSGKAVLDALQNYGVDAFGIDADEQLLNRIQTEQVDRVFIALHGRDGEDGKLQGALDWLDIPYTGSGVLASALAMDKIRCKQLWRSLGIRTPDFYVLDEKSDWESIVNNMGTCFVKPVNEGSSIGIGKASSAEELQRCYEVASQFDHDVLAETWVDGAEFTISILAGEVLPVIELKPASEFYDFNAKYKSGETAYICPANLDVEATERLQKEALKAYHAVGCKGWARVDAMQDSNGEFWLLEINTVPGMTNHSLVPMAAKEAGLSFVELVMRILDSSFFSGASYTHG